MCVQVGGSFLLLMSPWAVIMRSITLRAQITFLGWIHGMIWLQGLILLPVVGKWMLVTWPVCGGKGIPTQVWISSPD